MSIFSKFLSGNIFWIIFFGLKIGLNWLKFHTGLHPYIPTTILMFIFFFQIFAVDKFVQQMSSQNMLLSMFTNHIPISPKSLISNSIWPPECKHRFCHHRCNVSFNIKLVLNFYILLSSSISNGLNKKPIGTPFKRRTH